MRSLTKEAKILQISPQICCIVSVRLVFMLSSQWPKPESLEYGQSMDMDYYGLQFSDRTETHIIVVRKHYVKYILYNMGPLVTFYASNTTIILQNNLKHLNIPLRNISVLVLMPSDCLREVSDLAPVFQCHLSPEKHMIWTYFETHDVLMLSSVIVPPGLAMWAPPLEREPEPREPHAVGEPVHHQEVPGAASGRQGPGLRGGVQAAAQRQAANRTAHAGPAGTFHRAAGQSHSVESNRKLDLSVCVMNVE